MLPFIACIITLFVFSFHELVVPDANYKAATVLEREWNVDRTQLGKYNKKNIIYQEFENNQHYKKIKLILFAEQFISKELKRITIIEYKNKRIKRIIIADSAKWKGQQKWQLFSGSFYILDNRGIYTQNHNFDRLSLKLNKNVLNYINHQRDNREMNVIDLYRRLMLVKYTNNVKQVRAIETSIQERYAEAFSCITFGFIGSVLGVNSRAKASHNSLGIALIVIFIYYFAKFLSTALAASKVISIFWGAWLPNSLCLIVGFLILKRTQRNII